LLKKRFLVAILVLIHVFIWSEDVFLLRQANASEASQLWERYATVPAEAAAWHAALRFERQGRSIQYTRLSNLSYQIDDHGVIITTRYGSIIHYTINFLNAPQLPVADRHLRITIAASALRTNRPMADSPALLAIEQAIKTSGYQKGQAWISAIELQANQKFLVTVALKKD